MISAAAGDGASHLFLLLNHDLIISIDVVIFGFLDKQGTNDKRCQRDDDRVPQTVVDITFEGDQGKRGSW